jgi:hypothetical protein
MDEVDVQNNSTILRRIVLVEKLRGLWDDIQLWLFPLFPPFEVKIKDSPTTTVSDESGYFSAPTLSAQVENLSLWLLPTRCSQNGDIGRALLKVGENLKTLVLSDEGWKVVQTSGGADLVAPFDKKEFLRLLKSASRGAGKSVVGLMP